MDKSLKEKLLQEDNYLLKEYVDLDFKAWQFNNLTQKIKTELLGARIKKYKII